MEIQLFMSTFLLLNYFKKISSKAGSVPPTAYGKAIFHTIAKELLRVQLGTTPEWQNSLTD